MAHEIIDQSSLIATNLEDGKPPDSHPAYFDDHDSTRRIGYLDARQAGMSL
jgi:hypothetical protein